MMGICETILTLCMVCVLVVGAPLLLGFILFATTVSFVIVMAALAYKWTRTVVAHLWAWLNAYGIDSDGSLIQAEVRRFRELNRTPPLDSNLPPQVPDFSHEYPPIRDRRIKAWCAEHGIPPPVKNPNDYDQGYDWEEWKRRFPVQKDNNTSAVKATVSGSSGPQVQPRAEPTSSASLTCFDARASTSAQESAPASGPPSQGGGTTSQRSTTAFNSSPFVQAPTRLSYRHVFDDLNEVSPRAGPPSFDDDPLMHLEGTEITAVDESVPEDPARFGLLPSQGLLRDFETVGGYSLRPFTQEDLEQLDALNGEISLYPEYYNHPISRRVSNSSRGATSFPPSPPAETYVPVLENGYREHPRGEDALAQLVRVVQETAAQRQSAAFKEGDAQIPPVSEGPSQPRNSARRIISRASTASGSTEANYIARRRRSSAAAAEALVPRTTSTEESMADINTPANITQATLTNGIDVGL